MFAFTLNFGLIGLWLGEIVGLCSQMLMFFLIIHTADWERITADSVERIAKESADL